MSVHDDYADIVARLTIEAQAKYPAVDQFTERYLYKLDGLTAYHAGQEAKIRQTARTRLAVVNLVTAATFVVVALVTWLVVR